METTIAELLKRRRLQCLVNGIAYHVYGKRVITDSDYDKLLAELKDLVEKHPDIAEEVPYNDICPSHNEHSRSESDYPPNLCHKAKFLISVSQKPIVSEKKPPAKKKKVEKKAVKTRSLF